MSVHERYRDYLPDQREFFDTLISEDWDSYFSEDWDKTRRFEVAALFDRIQPASILDIGCGCGFHDQEMATYPFVETVVGIDYSSKSIERANTHYPHPKVQRLVSDLGDLGTGSYDLVVSWQVFEHLNDPRLYFSSAMRVLKKDGWLVIFTPNRMRLANRKRILKRQAIQYCDPQHFYEYVPKEMKNIGLEHGLEFIDWFGYRLSGMKFIDRMDIQEKLKWGQRLPWFADLFCIIFKKT